MPPRLQRNDFQAVSTFKGPHFYRGRNPATVDLRYVALMKLPPKGSVTEGTFQFIAYV